MNELNVELRTETGKGVCRKLRSAGRIPAVVYGKGFPATSLSINIREFSKCIEGGANKLFTLAGAEAVAGTVVIVSTVLKDAIKGTPRHADLHKVNMDEIVHVEVQIKAKGTAKGVKDGGILDIVKHSVKIECLPAFIPAHINVDVTELTIGHSIHISEIKLPANIKIMDDPSAAVISIVGRHTEAPAAEA